MCPDQGQGGAQAIEDAAAMGTLLANIPPNNLDSKAIIEQRLHMYQEVRRRRAAAIQIFSNSGQDEAEKVEQEARGYVDGSVPSK